MTSELCIDFVNSLYKIHSTGRFSDRLLRPDWRQSFTAAHGLALAQGLKLPLQHLSRERQEIRRILDAWAGGAGVDATDLEHLDRLVAAAPGSRHVRDEAGGPTVVFEPDRHDWTWILAEVAVSAVEIMAGAEPRRLKVCANPDCTWMFYDQSYNASRRWCDVRACGNLVKVREFRARHRAGLRPRP
jgi:predicted RNA-binding Zn ribbon-like protein